MRKILFLFSILTCVSAFSQNKISENDEYYFYENKGQILDQEGKQNSGVKYLFHSAGLNVQLRSNGFSYDIYEVKKTANPNSSKFNKNKISDVKLYYKDEFNYENLFHRIDIEFLNSNKNAFITAEGKSPDYENYYNIPNKPEGITNVYRYQKILYKNIYPNIDLLFFKPKDTTKPIEYNFIVNPGGKISDIKMKFSGAPALIKDGKLTMNVRFGEIYENIPNSWIENKDTRKNINVAFKNLGNQVFGFKAPVNTSNKTIIIDPVPTRIWGSYSGGAGDDYGRMKTDIQNTGYLFGATNSSTNYATSGAYQSNIAGSSDAYIMKLTKDGQRIWGTYYGFAMVDIFNDVDFDENFNIYAGGTVQRGVNNENIVLVKFDSSGNLIFQKEFVSSRIDELYTVSYNQNQVYIGGDAYSSDFPTVNALQPAKLTPVGMTDGIIASLNATTGNADWATYFGGSASTGVLQIFSSVNDLEIIAVTQAVDIPMVNPFQPANSGVADGVYLKLSKSGNMILRSSYYGNSGQDIVRKARIIDNILILPGQYSTPAFPSGQPGVWRVNLATNTITKSYYFDFPGQNQLTAYPDSYGNVFFTGLHSNGQPDISTPGAYMGMPPMYISTFLIKYNQNDVKEWGTYYTGNKATQLGMVTKDYEDYIYLTGMSSGNTTGIATPGTFQQSPGGGNDMFIAKFKDCTSSSSLSSNSPVCINSTIQLNATGGTNYSWTGPNGFTSNVQNPVIPNATTANSGVYICQISGSGVCDGTFTINVVVNDNIPANDYTETLCNKTGNNTMDVNLLSYQGDIVANPNNYIFTYTDNSGNTISNPSSYVLNLGTTIINVKIATVDGCSKMITLTLILNSPPCPGLGTSELAETVNVKVYPNPVENVLHINSKLKFERYMIYNSEGRIITEQKLNGENIDVSSLEKGNYVLELLSKNTEKTIVKFIKN